MGCVGGKINKEATPRQSGSLGGKSANEADPQKTGGLAEKSSKEDHPRQSLRFSLFSRKPSDGLNKDEMTTEDWQEIQDVLKILRTQGTDFDITIRALERMFKKHPETMQLFLDTGVVKPGDFQKPLRAQVRLILDALNKLVDLKNEDERAFSRYRKELIDLHGKIEGFDTDFYQYFGECLFHSLQTTLGSTLTKTQYESFRKFCGNLQNLMTSTEDQDTSSSVDRVSDTQSEWRSTTTPNNEKIFY